MILIHSEGISPCIETAEPNYELQNGRNTDSFGNDSLDGFKLNYILDVALKKKIHFHIATHAEVTNTCQEKADLTGLPIEKVIKGYYLQDNLMEVSYGLMIPGNRTYNKYKVASAIGIKPEEVEARISRSKWLPVHMKYGTVHPFASKESFTSSNGEGLLEKIIFDESLIEQKGLADFSFTTPKETGYDNHRLSIQMNCLDAYTILQDTFGERICSVNLC